MTRKRTNLQFDESPRLLLLGLVTLLTLLIWFVDIIASPRLSVSLFYLLPIGLAAWYLGRTAGFLISISSAVAWLVTDLVTNPAFAPPLVPYTNAAIRLGFFLIVSTVIAALRAARRRQAELTTFIIHDLRSPLASMLVSLQLIKEESDAAAGLTEKNQEALAIGLKSAYYMESLINSLLELARLEAGRMPLQPEAVSVEELLQAASEQVALIAGQQRVRLQLQAKGRQHALRVDRDLTVRVLVNLLSNAISYTPSNSTVTLQAQPDGRNMFQFCVRDEGPGIPREWQDRAFRKFDQAQARKAGVAVGSGLGLSFCKMAVEAQGGKIWIEEAAQENGAVICLTLPQAPVAATGGE